MTSFAVSLLIVVLALVLLQFLLDAVALKEPARRIVWVIAIVAGILWLFGVPLMR